MAISSFLQDLGSLVVRSISFFRNKFYDLGITPSLEPPLLAISIGNITFGGTGKTPLALFLLSFLQNEGWRPCLISRGYKGKWEKKGGLLSDGRKILASWQEAGDEPFMIAQRFPKAPVIVGRKRYASCLRAVDLGCNAAVLDDAFQHRQLKRHLDIVLMSPGDKAQRECWSALKRADLILIQGKKEDLPKPVLKIINSFKIAPPVFGYNLRPSSVEIPGSKKELPPEKLKGKRISAFCGLARPESFYSTLIKLGARLEDFLIFPDHYFYPDSSLKKIIRSFEEKKPEWMVTTEKDVVKLKEKTWFLNRLPLAVLKINFVPDSEFTLFLRKFLENYNHLKNQKD